MQRKEFSLALGSVEERIRSSFEQELTHSKESLRALSSQIAGIPNPSSVLQRHELEIQNLSEVRNVYIGIM